MRKTNKYIFNLCRYSNIYIFVHTVCVSRILIIFNFILKKKLEENNIYVHRPKKNKDRGSLYGW